MPAWPCPGPEPGHALMIAKPLLLGLAAASACAQSSDRVDLGRLQTGATVSFVRDAGGEWGVEIADGAAPRIRQTKPARLEVFRTEGDILWRLGLQRRAIAWRPGELRGPALSDAGGYPLGAVVRALVHQRRVRFRPGPRSARRHNRRGNQTHPTGNHRCASSVWCTRRVADQPRPDRVWFLVSRHDERFRGRAPRRPSGTEVESTLSTGSTIRTSETSVIRRHMVPKTSAIIA
jgi:hypothetical protein